VEYSNDDLSDGNADPEVITRLWAPNVTTTHTAAATPNSSYFESRVPLVSTPLELFPPRNSEPHAMEERRSEVKKEQGTNQKPLSQPSRAKSTAHSLADLRKFNSLF